MGQYVVVYLFPSSLPVSVKHRWKHGGQEKGTQGWVWHSLSLSLLWLCFHDYTPYSSSSPLDNPSLHAPSFCREVPAIVLAPARLPSVWVLLTLPLPCIQPTLEKATASCCG